MTETRNLLDDGTVEIKTETVKIEPRYVAEIFSNPYDNVGQEDIDSITDNDAYIYCHGGRNNFEILTTEADFEPECVSPQEDFEAFKQYIAKYYPKENTKCYYLMAHIHGRTAFYLSDDCSRVCQFDSGCAGFIAIRKDNLCADYDDNNIAKILTDAWEGDYLEYRVFDNLADEEVEQLLIGNSFAQDASTQETLKKWQEKYNVDFSKVEVNY